ncbi:MAG: SMI1/KNR4 family protein [Planctomycetota bacterium]|jgi:hypothetical protein
MNERDIGRIESELEIQLPDSYKKVVLSYPFGPESIGYTCMLANDAAAVIELNKSPSFHSIIHTKKDVAHPLETKNCFWIGNDGGEEEYYLDISTTSGAVLKFDLETGELTEFAPDMDHYIERIHEIDREIDEDERETQERRKKAKWWEFWKKL